MGVSVELVTDMVQSTQRELDKDKWTNLMAELREYIALPMLYQRGKIEMQAHGTGIRKNINIGGVSTFRNTRLFEVDNEVNFVNIHKNITMDFRHSEVSDTIDIRMPDMNGGEQAIFNLVKSRNSYLWQQIAEGLETGFWSKGPADSTDDVTWAGVDYWLVQNTAEGFNGAAPAGHTAGAGGLLHSRWQNYTNSYTTISKADAIKKMRKAYRKTNFKSPIPSNSQERKSAPRRGIYTTLDNVQLMEEIIEQQNMNLGNDLASKDGQVMFRGVAITDVPQLETAANSPIYMIDWSTLYPIVLKGHLFRDTTRPGADQHNQVMMWKDLTHQTICTNRRANSVLRAA
jgi:hypothetical protein